MSDKILEMLNNVEMINGRYIITPDMAPELREVCENTNAAREERDKILLQRRKIKRSMGL